MPEAIKGSQWRKWDLHIHSNHSIETRAKLTVLAIFQEAIARKIAVVAISDHSNVNGLDEIWSVWENNEVEIDGNKFRIRNHIVFFPAIELKATCGKRGVHFIALLPPYFKNEKVDQRFFTENILSKIDLTKTRITESGKGDYNKGIFEIAVDLKKTSDLIHQFGGLISAHAYGKDHNFEDEIAHPKTETPTEYELLNALGEEKELLMKDCIDICELNNNGDKAQKQAKFYLTKFSKPSIICSDSHESYSGCTAWIKADPTFNGLKQIVYEPESRVCIKDDCPESKISYTIIDAVRFVDNRSVKEFGDEWISLNPNLNSIIGGKSSGKSLLLYHIAKTIDPQRIESINSEKGTYKTNLEYPFEKEKEFNFEVKWADGPSYSLKSEERPNRPITYIPQLFLNRLAEDQREELNNIVHKMLVDSFPDYKTFRSETDSNLEKIRAEIFSVIDNYFKIKTDLKTKETELAELGDKKAIEENITVISGRIDQLRKESQFSDADETTYAALVADRKGKADSFAEIETGIKNLEALKKGLIAIKDQLTKSIQSEVFSRVPSLRTIRDDGFNKAIQDIVKNITQTLTATLEKEIESRFKIIESSKEKLEIITKQLEGIDNNLAPFAAKMTNKTAFEENQTNLQIEIAKLALINDKSGEIDKLKKELIVTPILEKYTQLFECYKSIVEMNKKYKTIQDTDNLELSSSIKIDDIEFSENFIRKIDKRSPLLDQDLSKVFNLENHLQNIADMLGKIMSGKISLRTGVDEYHAILSLLDDYFKIDYNLMQGGDDLLKMSPGKRGIILFQLFLHLSKSTNPILIDQPEDNIDNRTVYQELNEFIRGKKVKRQIIIVSHNPNLVVSTDSENVIVANQDGQNKSGKNRRFKFEYVNGALENTFLDPTADGVLYKCGIREHVCEILEGGKDAFEKRETKYGFK